MVCGRLQRGLALLLGGTAFSLSATGCMAPTTDPASSGSATAPARALTNSASASTPVGTPPRPIQLQIPRPVRYVAIIKYDAQRQDVEYHAMTENPTSDYPRLLPDPADAQAHRLSINADAVVRTTHPWRGPYKNCQPQHCTAGNVIDTHIAGSEFWAAIHLDTAGRIDAVEEV